MAHSVEVECDNLPYHSFSIQLGNSREFVASAVTADVDL